MTLTYIHWRDACSEEAAEPHVPVSDQPLMDLKEVGWVIGETGESVSLGMEIDAEGKPSRWRLHIPKVNIIERRDFELEKLLKLPRARKKK